MGARVLYLVAGLTVAAWLAVLIGCAGGGTFNSGQRAPWRAQVEEFCLASGVVHASDFVRPMELDRPTRGVRARAAVARLWPVRRQGRRRARSRDRLPADRGARSLVKKFGAAGGLSLFRPAGGGDRPYCRLWLPAGTAIATGRLQNTRSATRSTSPDSAWRAATRSPWSGARRAAPRASAPPPNGVRRRLCGILYRARPRRRRYTRITSMSTCC